MRGQDRRCRQQWEMTRLLAGLVYKVLTGDDYDLQFPWDESDESEHMTDKDLEEMRAKARAIEEWANRRGGNL